MKQFYLHAIVVIALISCEKDTSRKISDDMIGQFYIRITTPEKYRDYSYHNEGMSGVFENPETETEFNGTIVLNLDRGEDPVKPEELIVEWTSSIDNILYSGRPNSKLESGFRKKLSKGVHTIYFKVTINSNHKIYQLDSVIITNVMSLNSSGTDKSIRLNWQKYEGTDFISYLVYKYNTKPIATIEDIETTTFEDFEISLADSTSYQIVVDRKNTTNTIFGSNMKKDIAGNYIKIENYIYKMIPDPKRNRVYGIINPGKYSYAKSYGMVIIGTENDVLTVQKHLLETYCFWDLDISSDGNSLFLCGNEIIQLDLNTDSIVKEIKLSYSGHKIEAGKNNRLYYHVTPPSSGDTPLVILNSNTGSTISINQHNDFEFRHGDIEYNALNNMIYHGQSNINAGYLIRYDVSEDYTVPKDPQGYNFDYPDNFLLISNDGKNIYWQDQQFDQNLNPIRSLDHQIIGCSANNQFIADYNNLYSLSDYKKVMTLPNLRYGDTFGLCFTNNDNSILFYGSNEPLYEKYETYLYLVNLN